jgi:DNA modification methylase
MTLHHASALDILPTIADESIDLIMTDPPYPVISGGSGPTSAMHRRPAGMLSANDGKIFQHNSIEFRDYLPHLFRVLKDRTHMYLMVNFLNLEEALDETRRAGFGIHNLLVWEKNNATPNRWYMKNCEYTIFARKGPAKAINDKGSKTVHRFNNIIGNKAHPTEKPLALLSHYILNSTNEGDTVLDPFMGSGSTGLAAIQSGRWFVGIEIDDQYFQVASERINQTLQFYGRTA